MVYLGNFAPLSFADLLLSSSSSFSNSLLISICASSKISSSSNRRLCFSSSIFSSSYFASSKTSSGRLFTVLLTSSVICWYSVTCFSISRLHLRTSSRWAPFSIFSVRERYHSVVPGLFAIALPPLTRSFHGFWVRHLA